MGETICKKCGGILSPEEDCSPTLWCTCPVIAYKEPDNDEDVDPSGVEDYYDV